MTAKNEMAAMGSLSQQAAAWLIGRTPRALRDSDAPRESDGRYNARALVVWFTDRQSPEALIESGGDSPSLERYRAARAALSELELAQLQGSLLSRDQAKPVLERWSALLRRAGDRLRKRFGPDAATILGDALDQCQKVVDQLGTDSEGSDV